MDTNPYLVIALYWFFSAVVGGMPEPVATSSCAYTWAYQSAHILAGNIKTAVQSRYNMKT